MKKITPRSTKSDILAAHNALAKELRALKAKAKTTPAPQKALPPAPSEAAAAATTELSIGDIIGRLRGLTGHIGESASGLQAELTTEATTLERLRKQADEVTTQLQQLHAIEVTEHSLGQLIARYAETRDAAQTDLQTKKEAFEVELDAQRMAWDKEQQEHAATTKQITDDLERTRARDQQEYDYDRQQHLAQEQDARVQAQQQFEAEQVALSERKAAEWAEHDKQLAAREQEFAELQSKADAFEDQRNAAVKKAEGEGTGIAKRQAKTQGDLKRKDNEAVRRVFELKIESLEDTLSKQEAQIEQLSTHLEAARTQTTTLAVKAIDGASNASSFAAIKEIALEQAKNTPKSK
ncbi:MAG: hypothetical protein K0V04_46555 [Deltaproteobacteria bacterium]|nr:hypothetical protein [Deltaproteobacteria bacterium]